MIIEASSQADQPYNSNMPQGIAPDPGLAGHQFGSGVFLFVSHTMPSEIDAYNTAISKIEKAKTVAANVAAVITAAGEKIANWRDATIYGVNDVAIPADVNTVSPIGALILSEWFTAKEIAHAIYEYRFAKIDLQAAYERIPKHLRRTVKEPLHYY